MPVDEISREQQYVVGLYERVDALRDQASARLALALREDGRTPQARLDRDAAIARYAGQLARLDAAENGVCFGRLDLRSGECLHIGRIGLRDEPGEGEPLLLDWRAPAARAFYVATANAPHGVRRRRHIVMRGRRVTGLVVQGGPGTGKTAVALHRAAYLLYTHPHLAKRGVLVVGPSATFLGYISQVLPGLGETNVLLRTVGELFPGVAADRGESRLTEEVKGRTTMAGLLATAVRDRQATGPAEFEFDGETLRLDAEVVRAATRRARAARLPHNRARPVFQRQIVAALAGQYAKLGRELAERLAADVSDVLAEASEAIEADLAAIPLVPGSGEDEQLNLAALRRELWADPKVRARLDDLWPALTPRRLLDELFADSDRLAAAAPALTAAERAALLREPGGWSSADVPLLDEAAELLGRDDRADRARSTRERAQQIAYAQGVLDIAAGSSDEETITSGFLDAAALAARQAGAPPWRMATTRDALPATLAEITSAEAGNEGQLAVIVPDTRVAELAEAVARAVPGASFGESQDLTSPVVVLGARQAKDLGFDSVLIADPGAILAGSPRGRNDLYVAMTRSTQRLGVLHPGRPPADLAALPVRRPGRRPGPGTPDGHREPGR